MTPVDWYFDFISPFAYLHWQWIKRAGPSSIRIRPVLFAGLLGHHGHKGPAEIPEKRLFTYRHVQWRADAAGIPMRFPPAHPFNPLPALRLCAAAGCEPGAVDAIFDHIWANGLAGDSPQALAPVATLLGMTDPEAACASHDAKAILQDNFRQAIESGVFGVPTLVADGHLFWGDDAAAMFDAYRADPALFESPEMRRIEDMPVALSRREVR